MGGTEQGSMTPAGRVLVLLEPTGAEVCEASPQEIRWTWVGQAWQSGDTLSLEDREDSSLSAGVDWAAISGAGAVAVEAGTFAWDISAYVSSPLYKVRITSNEDTSLAEESEDYFQIRVNGALTYYVNDGSTADDAWCTAVGDDANDGLTPATPKATIQDVIDDYDLNPSDVVRIDTGTYNLTANIIITSDDEGDSSAPVTFEASPYGVTIDRGDTSVGARVWHVDDADYVTITTAAGQGTTAESWMNVTGANIGVYTYCADHMTLARVEMTSNAGLGVQGYSSEYLELTNSLIHDNGNGGVHLYQSDNSLVENNTIAFHPGRQLSVVLSSQVTLRNNIFWADGTGALAQCLYCPDDLPTSDYNLLYATNGGLSEQLRGHTGTMAFGHGPGPEEPERRPLVRGCDRG